MTPPENHFVEFSIEQFKEKYKFIPFLKDKEIYSNFNFSVFLDDYCNADCKFCVANIRSKTESRKNIFGKDYDKYLRSLEKIFAFLRPFNPTISLTGGEPTLFPKFKEAAELAAKFDFRVKAVTTNASALLKNDGEILESLIKNKWTYLNLSLPHTSDGEIRRLMRYKKEIPASFSALVRQVAQAVNGTTITPRLSCVLLKEGVHDLAGCADYVRSFRQSGINSFIFRQLTSFDAQDNNKEIVDYNKANLVPCLDIWRENDSQKIFEFFKYNIGYYYYVELYKYLGATVAFEAADLEKRKREMEKYGYKKVFEVVYHPNGNLCSGWDSSKEILLNYKDL